MAAVPHDSRTIMPAPSARSAITQIEQSRAMAEAIADRQIARANPRDEVSARDKIINAFASKPLAEIAKYSYARGGTDIEGPSIHSLRAVARAWGNISTGIEEISRANGQSECRAYAIDTETGFKDEKKFVVKHIRDKKGGGVVLTDERDIYELIANMGARRQRACLEAVVPKDVVDMAMDQVDVTLKADIDITAEYLKSLEEAFAKFGVSKAMLEAFIQRHLDAVTPAQVQRLKKIHTSLRDGVGKAEDWFDMTAAPPRAEEKPTVTRTEAVKEKLRKTKPEPVRDAAPSSSEPAPHAGEESPFADEAVALLALDGAASREEASEVVDACRGTPFYANIAEGYNKRWAEQV